jgi:hypothetical protein
LCGHFLDVNQGLHLFIFISYSRRLLTVKSLMQLVNFYNQFYTGALRVRFLIERGSLFEDELIDRLVIAETNELMGLF